MKRFALLLTVLGALLVTAQNTTRRNLRPIPAQGASSAAPAAYDTIARPTPHLVDLNGFDKPLRSRRETFFATNNAAAPVAALALTMTYTDQAGRMLHSAPVHVAVDIPPGETRQISIKSWDAQQSFYYIRSAVPTRTEQATPFDVSIAIDTIFCLPR